MMRTPFVCPECGRAGIEIGMPGEYVFLEGEGYDIYNVFSACPKCGFESYSSMCTWTASDIGRNAIAISFDEAKRTSPEETQHIYYPFTCEGDRIAS